MEETIKNILLDAGAYVETHINKSVMYIFCENDCNILLFLPNHREGAWRLGIMMNGLDERMKMFDVDSDKDEVFRTLDVAMTQIALERL